VAPLAANCAIYSSALDITDAANQFAAEGHPVDFDDLATVTPYLTHTIRRIGDLVLDLAAGTLMSAMHHGVVRAENLIRAGQAACWYSWITPPRRSCRRMTRCSNRS